jgi:hypothetical protein
MTTEPDQGVPDGGPMSQKQQPGDEWTFLRPDEFVDDEEVEKVDATAERPPEVSAMHVETTRGRALHDPGRSDVDTGTSPGEEAPAVYFEDEQPDGSAPEVAEGDHEPDLEEILESQHYAFEPTADESDEG